MKTVYAGGEGEIVEKKSRFIATVRLVEKEEDALAFIEEMKKKYWDARHNCYVYSVGKNREYTRCSDDGEPSGTAGRPMLDVILGEDIYNVAAVVTNVAIQKSTLLYEIPFMTVITIVLLIFGITGSEVTFIEGVIFWILFLIYLGYLFVMAKKGNDQEEAEAKRA